MSEVSTARVTERAQRAIARADGGRPARRTGAGGVLQRISRFFNGLSQPVAVTVAALAFLVVWQLVVMFAGIPRIILPGPVDVAVQVGEVTRQLFDPSGFLLGQLGVTIQEILIGFAAAVVGGFLIGLWVGLTEFGRKAVMPLFVMFEATPKIAFIPVFIAWFGFGITSKIVMAAFLSIFPIIIGTVSGLAATSVEERKLFASFNASPWMTFWKLRMHRALPFIFAGLKVAVVASVTGAVAAEFIGGGTGFGEQIRVAATRIDLDRVFAMILFLSVLGLALFLIVTWMQRTITHWDGERTPRRRSSKYPALNTQEKKK